MSKFDAWMKPRQVKEGSTIEYHMLDLVFQDGTSPVLIGKHVGKSNPGYVAALTKIEGKAKTRRFTEEESAQAFAELYADHVIVGWKNMQDSNGKEVEYNRDDCISILLDLPDYDMQGLVTFFSNPRRFTFGALSQSEAQEVGNGLPSSSNGG